MVQQPPVLSCFPTIHFNQSLFSELSCPPPSSFACTSSYLNQSFHFRLRVSKAIISALCHYCSQLHASSRTLYGSCGWREVSDFPCSPRPASCSPRSGPRRTSPRSERLQNNRGITAAHVGKSKMTPWCVRWSWMRLIMTNNFYTLIYQWKSIKPAAV